MHDIDFLPSEYRLKDDRRKWRDRRILVLAGVAAMIAATAWAQQHRAHRLAGELAEYEPSRAAAAQTQDALNELQSRLQLARASADLVTYLRHPWPRTRILAALLRPLPDEIAFEELRIHRETSTGRRPDEAVFAANQKREEEQSSGLPPAARDLKRLREESDGQQTIVTIAGVTTEGAALHQYLRELGQEDLFAKAELRFIETDKADPKRIRFRATLLVRPGYGQSGGPSGPNSQRADQNDQEPT